MTKPLPSTEIPSDIWENLKEVDYGSDDMTATMDAFSGAGIPFNLILGARGVILATRIRLHNFGELVDDAGIKINEKKQSPMWLGTETLAILENQAASE